MAIHRNSIPLVGLQVKMGISRKTNTTILNQTGNRVDYIEAIVHLKLIADLPRRAARILL